MPNFISRHRLPLAFAVTTVALALVNAVRSRAAVRANPPAGTFVEVNGVTLHYVEKGSGPPILLLHGNGVMLEDWRISGLFDTLAKSHRVIAVDRPGYGYSSRPRGIVWTPERQADLMADFLALVGADRPRVVGHSWGAMVATAMAIRHPSRLSGVALLGGYYFPTARPDVLMMIPSATPGLGDLLTRTTMPLMAEALQGAANRQMFGPAEPSERWRRQFSWGMAVRPTRMRAGAADAVLMIPAARRLARHYRDVRLPVQIIAGRGDRLVKASQAERLHKQLPDSRLTLVEGVGHMVHHSAPEKVAAAIGQI